MKKLVCLTALICSNAALAATPIEGWYSSAFGGYAYQPNNLNVTNNGIFFSKASYKSSYDAGASLGFKSTPLRYEAELTYLKSNFKQVKQDQIPQVGVNGRDQSILIMTNVLYDFKAIAPPIEPFLGVGIGYAFMKAQLNSKGPLLATRFSPSNTVFAYQATAGLTYNFAEAYALNLGYRYVATDKAGHFGKNTQAHLGNLGVVCRFDESHYK